MPPKKAGGTKAAKAAQKVVEDKTFGLKNKKGAKQQKFVQQVQQSVNAAANKGNRGPSKKEMKELQKKQEEEMLALFNAVPKKQNENEQQQSTEDLDPDAGPTFTDITQEIEYKRANVVARTKIDEAVFQAWRSRKLEQRRAAAEEARKERLKRGLLTGREIFMDAGHTYEDDENCADDADMMREINDEDEISRMEAEAEAARRAAWAEAGYQPEADGSAAGPSTTTLQLSEREQAELFDDDDDDDDLDLDELENQVKSTAIAK